MKKFILKFLLGLVFITHFCAAQQKQKVDSLFTVAKFAKDDLAKMGAWNELAYLFRNAEPDTVFYFTAHAMELATKLGSKRGMADALTWSGLALSNIGKYDEAHEKAASALRIYERLLVSESSADKIILLKQKTRSINLIATIYYYQGNYSEAVKNQMLVLDIANKLNDMDLLTSSYQNLGVYYKEQGNYGAALKNGFSCLKIYEKINSKYGIADCYGNLGTIYEAQKNLKQARYYYEKSLVIKGQLKDKKGIAIACTNLGNIYRALGKGNEALSYYLQGLAIDKELDDKFSIANDYNSIGNNWKDKGDTAKALESFSRGLKLSQEINAKYIVAYSKIAIGEIIMQQGKVKEAQVLFNSALELAKESGSNESIQEIYAQLSRLDSIQGKWKGAFEHHKLYLVYRDSVFNQKNTKEMTEQLMQYDFDKKESFTKAEQEKKDVISLKEMQKQKLLRNGFVGGFALVSLFAGVFFSQRNKIKIGKKRSDELLLNILPEEVAEELKAKGSAEAQLFEEVTVLFTDFKGFTAMSEKLSAKELVRDIHECFSAFDHIIEKHGIEKIKTIGDAYMAAGGIPTPNKTHAVDVVNAALEIRAFIEKGKALKIANGNPFFEIRIGINTGPVVAGIVGIKKFAYDIWGDTVNVASRMESSGEVGKVNISGSTYKLVQDKFTCVHRGKISAKGKGEIDMYFIDQIVDQA